MADDRRVRRETDLLGAREVPSERLWGIHTMRALENASAGSSRVPLSLIRALAQVKKSCALANQELGCLEARKAEAIIEAAEEVRLSAATRVVVHIVSTSFYISPAGRRESASKVNTGPSLHT